MAVSDIANRQNKIGWGIFALSALGLECAALFFQYAMGLEPCIMCVYQRLAVAGVLFTSIIGFLASRKFWGQIFAHGLMVYASGEGLMVAKEHVEMQSGDSFFFACEFVPNFPSWMPLHEWFPGVFAATGDCGEISWQFFDMSMPEWMVVVFTGYMVAQVLMLAWVVGDHVDRVNGHKRRRSA
ncbi:MAG: disulfide bond formation protein DsbB [Candidatus Marinimicrobia bacterium]|nr:disulfide bond formation protein DsbB [Candidatus Neomarinimicrobiota bacterium]|tara:strand:+ start:301 stop:849 length:549 start_codon:yes stop_codon:yes gene_type:complete